ncbi:hypothetical protein [Spongiactinospora sp. TRM90649]|uniref:hypothetical protein n=1 Tax=Spongiactinospora sp. TRM90649 TaxID=3031114 RepID=UPI0023F878D5|nr:hypothetical protein [Spongiactinospora sp. TRM90649]MDF5753931.1 hypothetical protein [Spongiactinospora sp. TRM90649]
MATDIDRLAALLRDDVRGSMPPTPGLFVGRDAVVNDWVVHGFAGMKDLRAVLTSMNRQPAVAFYHWRAPEGAYEPLTIAARSSRGAEPRPSYGEGAHRHPQGKRPLLPLNTPLRQSPNDEGRHEQQQ